MSRDAYIEAIVSWERLGLELRAAWYQWLFEMGEIAFQLDCAFARIHIPC